MTTNGLIGTHFIPAANDHGMPTTVAAGLLATIGILDVAGTVFSGWLTDRVDPRLLLVVYYAGRGLSLLLLPSLLSPHAEPSTWVFVIFYGLDWVATVPPTIVLCRNYFGTRLPSCSAGCSHRTNSARRSPRPGRAGYGICRATTTWRSTWRPGLCFVAAALLCLNVRKAQVSAVCNVIAAARSDFVVGCPLPLTCRCDLNEAEEPKVKTRTSKALGRGRRDRRDRRIAAAGDQRLCRPARRPDAHADVGPRSPIRRGRAATPSRRRLPN